MAAPIIRIKATTPYEMGFEHGRLLKKPIQDLYKKVMDPTLSKLQKTDRKRDIYKLGKAMLERMDPSIMKELQGLSDGANISLKMVIKVNTFLTVFPEAGACSVISADFATNPHDPVVLAVDNNAVPGTHAHMMRTALKETHNMMETMKTVQKMTLQTIIFNPREQKFYLSHGSEKAAEGPFFEFTKEQLFEGDTTPPRLVDKAEFDIQGKYLVGRNLDWGLSELGKHTIVLVRGSIASPTFPGYVGCISAMRSDGFNISHLQQGSTLRRGVENTLQYYHTLSTELPEKIESALEHSPAGGTCNTLMSGGAEAAAFYYLEGDEVRKEKPTSLKVLEFRRLFQEYANEIFGAVYDLSPHPRASEGDPLWGEHHFDDDPKILERAIRQVLSSKEDPFFIEPHGYYIIPASTTIPLVFPSPQIKQLIVLMNAENPNPDTILVAIKAVRRGYLILHHLWRLAGSPMGDPEWAEHHLDTHLHLLPEAILSTLHPKYERLHAEISIGFDTGLKKSTIKQIGDFAEELTTQGGSRENSAQVLAQFLCDLEDLKLEDNEEYKRLDNLRFDREGIFREHVGSMKKGSLITFRELLREAVYDPKKVSRLRLILYIAYSN